MNFELKLNILFWCFQDFVKVVDVAPIFWLVWFCFFDSFKPKTEPSILPSISTHFLWSKLWEFTFPDCNHLSASLNIDKYYWEKWRVWPHLRSQELNLREVEAMYFFFVNLTNLLGNVAYR